MILLTIALLGSIAASDFAKDYNHSIADAHEHQIQRELDRIERQLDRLETVMKGTQAERDFWSSGRSSIAGGGGKVDGRSDSKR